MSKFNNKGIANDNLAVKAGLAGLQDAIVDSAEEYWNELCLEERLAATIFVSQQIHAAVTEGEHLAESKRSLLNRLALTASDIVAADMGDFGETNTAIGTAVDICVTPTLARQILGNKREA